MRLIVSLPRNDLQLAQAAESAGADAIKLHMNVEHRASGTRFGSFAEEEPLVLRAISTLQCEVGLMPGTDLGLPTQAELASLAAAGLKFIDIYIQHLPLWMSELPLQVIAAIGHEQAALFLHGSLQPVAAAVPRIDVIEASITAAEDYGKPFTHFDLLSLLALRGAVGLPVLVPTQKAITPDDARRLASLGIDALMIGAIVTSNSADSIARATAAYRRAIDTA